MKFKRKSAPPSLSSKLRIGGVLAFVFLGSALGAVAQTLTLSLKTAPPNAAIRVAGTGFGTKEAVDIYFDTTDELLGITNASGALPGYTLTIPAMAAPGTHWITAVGRKSGNAAQTSVGVHTPWPEHGFGKPDKGLNPTENQIAASNVGQLDIGWRARLAGRSDAQPSVAGGTVFVQADDGRIYAFNATTGGAHLWTYKTGGTDAVGTPAVSGGIVYFGTTDSNMYALNANTGALIWKTATAGAIYSSPIVVGGLVYFGSFDGSVYALKASTGAVLWTYATGSAVYGSPAYSNGTLFIASQDSNLYALNATTGTKLWSYTFGGVGNASPAIVGNLVICGSDDGIVHAIDTQTGTERWSYTANAPIGGSPAIANGKVFAATTDDNIYALDFGSGASKWTATLDTPLVGALTTANGVVYGTNASGLVAFDANSGTKLLELPVGGSPRGGATISDGTIFMIAGTNVDTLVALQVNAGNSQVVKRNDQAPQVARLRPNFKLTPAP
ncbi:MAG TPA: PQQ-binding-like beta-propeller repeat protein [Rhizomicrobium sp.]|jgi:outer membrane protein assembly factor BamB